MKNLFIIGVGGFIGSAARYLLSSWVQDRFINSTVAGFPFGTLGVNILGCFIIGLIFGYSVKFDLREEWRFFLITGICGGFTTFSAFSIEMVKLREGNMMSALSYMSASILLGLSATWAGIMSFRLF